MDQEKKNAIALMRYSVIAPLITGLADDYDSLSAYFNNAPVKGVMHPDGSLKHYAPGTIERWFAKMLTYSIGNAFRFYFFCIPVLCRAYIKSSRLISCTFCFSVLSSAIIFLLFKRKNTAL